MSDTAFDIHSSLNALGHQLPIPAAPAANYVPWRKTANGLLYISGQLPFIGDTRIIGKVEDDLSMTEATRAAEMCALNLLAHVESAVNGDWGRLRQFVQVTGFVNCHPNFFEHPTIINGASNLFGELLGDRGRHSRLALGANVLPFNAAVEVALVAELAA
jgi:enamine deaminase RidA (YjgF/YER057c/UK114 family)